MTNSAHKRTHGAVEYFQNTLGLEEKKVRYKAEKEAFYQRCLTIFDRVGPKLINDYYDWFIVIAPDSGAYVIDSNEEVAAEKARQQHPHSKLGAFRLNENGACGRI